MSDFEELERLLGIKSGHCNVPVIIFKLDLNEQDLSFSGSTSKIGNEILKEINISENELQEIFKPAANAFVYCSRTLAKRIKKGLKDYEC